MSTQVRFKKLWFTIGLGWIALVIYLSLTSKPLLPDVQITHFDKFGHFVAYCWLMFWFSNLYYQTKSRLLLMSGFILLGLCMELLQSQTASRLFEWADLIANITGVVVGLLLTIGSLKYVIYRFELLFFKT